MLRIKPVEHLSADLDHKEHKLAKRLSAFDLIAIGMAAIIGAGIFVLTGTAAATRAGPAVVLSFILGGVGCGLAGLCYAELASCLPAAGSAYTYAYVSMGEFAAWTVGWALVLEYTVCAITVAIGWSGYLTKLLHGLGIYLPDAITRGAFDGGVINLPAVLLVLVLGVLLIVGVKESARVASALVVVKLAVVALFLAIGIAYVKPERWTPFMPFGWKGVLSGTGMIFFSYVGFDAVTTASEETKNPQKDMVVGILGALFFCTILYVIVSLVLTGMVPYPELDNPAPVALALEKVGVTWGHLLVTIGAVVGLSSVVLVFMMGQPRIFMAMSRDGLVPNWIAKVHPRYRTPHLSIIFVSVFVALGSAVLPIGVAGEMTSIGTLFAFVSVCVGVIALRKTHPHVKRSFSVPWSPWVPIGGSVICFVIMLGLSPETWLRFAAWIVLGWLIYFFYGRSHSRLAGNIEKLKNAAAAANDSSVSMASIDSTPAQ